MPTEFSGRGDPRRTLDLLWRRGERPTRGPKPGLSVDDIVAAAIRVADADGLAAVSMRRVADALGVGTMSLYRHVPGKGELVDLMLDRVVAEAPNPGPEVVGWRARLEHHALAALEHYRRHPWARDVAMTRPPLGPGVMGNYEALLASVAQTGLPVEEWNAIAQLISAYVEGAALWSLYPEQAERATGISDEAWWAEREVFWEEHFDPAAHPTLTHVWEAGAFEAPIEPFAYGLERVLDGIAARIAAHEAGGPSPGE